MKERLCFIGIGNMGSSIVDLILSKNLWDKNKLILCDCDQEKLNKYIQIKDLYLTKDATEVIKQSDNIVIAVKPQESEILFKAIKNKLKNNALIISIMAGISISKIQKSTNCKAVIRTMPNLPILLGKGVIGWSCSSQVNEKQKLIFKHLCSHFGKELFFQDESYLDVITALSGSGPMYTALFANSLIKAGKLLGLTEQQAKIATIQTLLGSALMLEKLSIPPEQLIKKITSKGGTTEQASIIFQQYNFTNIIIEAVQAAYSKAKILGNKEKNPK